MHVRTRFAPVTGAKVGSPTRPSPDEGWIDNCLSVVRSKVVCAPGRRLAKHKRPNQGALVLLQRASAPDHGQVNDAGVSGLLKCGAFAEANGCDAAAGQARMDPSL